MQFTGGMIIDGGIIFAIPNTAQLSGPVSGDATLTLGTLVDWTSNTYFYTANATRVLNIAGTPDYQFDTNNMLWQLFYAHKRIRLPVGSNRWGVLSRFTNINSFDLYAAISTEDNTIGKFNSNVDVLIGNNSGNQNYTANVLFESPITTQLTVPANRYFLLGITGGPFYKNYRRTANNFTIVNAGNAIVTVVNKVWAGTWPSGPTRGIPTQLGGNVSSYLEFTSNVYYGAIKFEAY
jgi:hypothetical protein